MALPFPKFEPKFTTYDIGPAAMNLEDQDLPALCRMLRDQETMCAAGHSIAAEAADRLEELARSISDGKALLDDAEEVIHRLATEKDRVEAYAEELRSALETEGIAIEVISIVGIIGCKLCKAEEGSRGLVHAPTCLLADRRTEIGKRDALHVGDELDAMAEDINGTNGCHAVCNPQPLKPNDTDGPLYRVIRAVAASRVMFPERDSFAAPAPFDLKVSDLEAVIDRMVSWWDAQEGHSQWPRNADDGGMAAMLLDMLSNNPFPFGADPRWALVEKWAGQLVKLNRIPAQRKGENT